MTQLPRAVFHRAHLSRSPSLIPVLLNSCSSFRCYITRHLFRNLPLISQQHRQAQCHSTAVTTNSVLSQRVSDICQGSLTAQVLCGLLWPTLCSPGCPPVQCAGENTVFIQCPKRRNVQVAQWPAPPNQCGHLPVSEMVRKVPTCDFALYLKPLPWRPWPEVQGLGQKTMLVRDTFPSEAVFSVFLFFNFWQIFNDTQQQPLPFLFQISSIFFFFG